ncbi:D-alanyl-D-alanine carboxypeptidase family protein [Marinobacterium rhizophilum]|uniref:D-alanyl-D-alanine carboxypeptidase n=1 Tax=Marinobacterium rhizophilum TaxID=420402 RepID=A0ABY5HLD6_9GAMM|nr:D-alanyl-D-alanine carboxypeptidase family protein [Marinobacterium rhizophilum]UTW12622.1 D-alanyl-D-alanine carboxypeptidase [Marinobacterium rhizophilum]
MFVLGLLFGLGGPSAWAGNPVLVVDAASGAILHQDRADQRWYPASLAKLMTLYLVFEALDDGRLKLDSPLPVSQQAAAQPAVRLGLRAGASITVAEAIAALATVSSNDVAVVLAEALAGTEARFAVRMTARAAALGMTDTAYRNASGLPDAAQVTTARDQAILARRLLQDFPRHYPLFATRSARYRGRTLQNHNGLLGRYPGTDGLKTGFTCAAGYNIVASAVRADRRLIAVVLGANSRAGRDAQVSRLLDTGFAAPRAAADAPALAMLEQRPEGLLLAAQGVVGRSGCERGRAVQAAVVWPIESWGVLLGIYAERSQAQRAVRHARAQLGGALRAGRPLLLERDMEHGTSWKALLIGYRHDNVGAVCLRLRARGLECVAQAPVVLNLPGYARR